MGIHLAGMDTSSAKRRSIKNNVFVGSETLEQVQWKRCNCIDRSLTIQCIMFVSGMEYTHLAGFYF
ncbi:hypothetical protein HED63_25070 [Ochrobactrum cytisi]|nr:hypothetical protein [Brucella cytisi]